MGKKWPPLGRILLVFIFLIGLADISSMSIPDAYKIMIGLLGFILFWCVCKFQRWAVIALSALFSLKILQTLIYIKDWPLVSIFYLAFYGLFVYYFNSKEIRALFNTGTQPDPSQIAVKQDDKLIVDEKQR